MELRCMASSPNSTWNFFASLMLSAWHSAASLYRLLAWSIVRWGEDGPDVNTLAGQVLDTWWDPVRLGTLGIAGACYRVSQKVEAWASIKPSQRAPTFFGHRSPLSRCAKTQGGRDDGGRLELGYLAVGSCRTAKAVKPTGADGKGGVEFTGVFCAGLFPLTSG